MKACLVECARAGIRNKQSYFYSRCQRIAARRGGKRVLTAIAHSMLTAIYHMLKEKVRYCDLGADYYTVINQEKSSFVTKVRDRCNYSAEITSPCFYYWQVLRLSDLKATNIKECAEAKCPCSFMVTVARSWVVENKAQSDSAGPQIGGPNKRLESILLACQSSKIVSVIHWHCLPKCGKIISLHKLQKEIQRSTSRCWLIVRKFCEKSRNCFCFFC